MHHYESMQYLNTVYPERHDVVKDVDDRMKCENVGKYMTFSDYSQKINPALRYIISQLHGRQMVCIILSLSNHIRTDIPIKEIKTPGSIL